MLRKLLWTGLYPGLAAGEQGERTLELRDDPPAGERPRHATRLLGLITEVMAEAGVGWESIDRIAVGVGPGTVTGLRIGIATAKANAEKNLRNARELFDGGSKRVFEGLGSNGNQKQLGDVSYVDRGSSPRPRK